MRTGLSLSKRRLPIAGFTKTSLVDWPGRVVAGVFLQGCNFRCPWCQNPDLVEPARHRKPLPAGDVLDYLRHRKGLLDGVVVTGGEAALAPGLPSFLEKIRDLGYAVKLDTNGSRPDLLADLWAAGLVEHIAVDYKVPFRLYPAVVGCTAPEAVQQSIRFVLERECGLVRTTVIPDLHTPEMLAEMVAAVPLLRARNYRLQPFRPGTCLDPEYNRLPETDARYLGQLAALIRA